MYTRKTKFKKVYDDFEKNNACSLPKESFFGPLMKSNPDLTFGQAMDAYLDDDNASDAWGIWCFELIGNKCAPRLRVEMLKKIKDPMKALAMKRRHFRKLNSKEIKILEKKYKGKLRKAEKEIDA